MRLTKQEQEQQRNERAIEFGHLIGDDGKTVRQVADESAPRVSKSTVHKDTTERLRYIDYDLYKKVRLTLDKHLAERHIRGGLATQRKYRNS